MGPGDTGRRVGGAALGAYDSDADRAFNLLDSILGADNVCSPSALTAAESMATCGRRELLAQVLGQPQRHRDDP